MGVVGIVAEYNPFHTGHGYQIAQTRQMLGEQTAIVAVMSGNWVQQADCAIADKWLRTRLALMGGVDLVLELPTVWAASTAESFARGAVEIMASSGVVTDLSFGSECGNVEALKQVAACLDSPEYHAGLRRFLDEGKTFASCRQSAVGELLGEELAALLSKPNNNLGVEYIRAIRSLNSAIKPMTVQRQGAAHNSVSAAIGRLSDGSVFSGPALMDMPQFVSATQIRMDLMEGRWDMAAPYLVPCGRQMLENNLIGLSALDRVQRAMLARVRTMTAEGWARLPDSGAAEGLPVRLERAGRKCTSMQEFFDLVKTKRYTHARLSRLVLWAYLGMTAADVPTYPPYIRVLGFNSRGREVLRDMKERASVPILTKPAHARDLDEQARRLFELEVQCTDLYDLCLEKIPAPGREWTTGPVILNEI